MTEHALPRSFRGSLLSTALAATVLAPLGVVIAGPALAADSTGRLYGRVETTSGQTYTGVLRWGDQEAFWDDLFNSGKTELPQLEKHGEKERRSTIEVLGRAVGIKVDHASRQFVTRFGYIDRIEVRGKAEARLTMRDGTEVDVEGSADDVEATVQVFDATLGDVKIPWEKIDVVDFLPTPSDASAEGSRLRGRVMTDGGEFEGWVQWDSQECLSIDELDGDEDGVRHSIEMGKIRSIARADRRSAEVVLKDGRTLVLDGTNDVNEDIRGILVEDARYGRVKIPWREFREVEFLEASSSGASYGSFAEVGELRGTVSMRGGGEASGRIVFDLDESYGWEMLDGERDEVAYTIPFALVASIRPDGSDAAVVTLRTGEELRLEETQDVSDRNDGVLVLGAEGEELVPWDEVERIDFRP